MFLAKPIQTDGYSSCDVESLYRRFSCDDLALIRHQLQ